MPQETFIPTETSTHLEFRNVFNSNAVEAEQRLTFLEERLDLDVHDPLKSYSVGEMFYYSAKAYRVNTDLNVGETPTTNPEKVDQIGVAIGSEVNDLTSSVTWADVPDANITQSSVIQHTGAFQISESQIVDLTHPSQVDDTAYGVIWDGDTTTAPSKNAVYDKIETLGGGTVQDGTTNALTPKLDTKSGSVAGNARGNEALDTQIIRNAATQVASGARSIILGGANNTASAAQGAVINANDSNATGSGSVIIGGSTNNASGSNDEILGSQDSSTSGIGSTIVGGSGCTNSGNWAIVAGGLNQTISQPRGSILGGSGNTVNHVNSAVIGGTNITTDAADTVYVPSLNVGAGFKMPTGATAGYVLTSDSNGVGTWQAPTGGGGGGGTSLSGTTANNTQTEIFVDGVASSRMTLTSNTTWMFSAMVAARSATESAGYKIEGVIKNDAGTTALVGTAVKTVFGEDDSAWDVTVEADDTNDALVFKVIGDTVDSVNWEVLVDKLEVS